MYDDLRYAHNKFQRELMQRMQRVKGQPLNMGNTDDLFKWVPLFSNCENMLKIQSIAIQNGIFIFGKS